MSAASATPYPLPTAAQGVPISEFSDIPEMIAKAMDEAMKTRREIRRVRKRVTSSLSRNHSRKRVVPEVTHMGEMVAYTLFKKSLSQQGS
jgi:hypothetical protein